MLIIAHIRKGDILLGQLFYSLISDEAMLGIILNFQVQRLNMLVVDRQRVLLVGLVPVYLNVIFPKESVL